LGCHDPQHASNEVVACAEDFQIVEWSSKAKAALEKIVAKTVLIIIQGKV